MVTLYTIKHQYRQEALSYHLGFAKFTIGLKTAHARSSWAVCWKKEHCKF
jgi:hypothetical protein